MQIQNHVKSEPWGRWPRCSRVEVREGTLLCVLDWDNQYDLESAYSNRPHLSFLQLRTDDELRHFTLRWGPLNLVRSARSEIRVSVVEFWSEQRLLSALLRLVNAVRNRTNERDAVAAFVTADRKANELAFEPDPPFVRSILGKFFPAASDFVEAVHEADIGTVRDAAAEIVRRHTMVVASAGFDVKPGRKPEIVARLQMLNLLEALKWMVWRDEWRGQPLAYCPECDKAFGPRSKHAKKYCSPECAHKVAARDWARRQSASKKKPTSKKGRSR